MKKILIVGASGFIGKYLMEYLLQKGYRVTTLTRTKITKKGVESYQWDPIQNYIETSAFDNVDVVINLAGENVGQGHWTKKRKSQILDSRVVPAKIIFDALKKIDHKPSCYISSSGVAIYGTDSGDEFMMEDAPNGNGFLANVTIQWEKAAHQFESLDIRTVSFRIGIVLGKNGGALPKMELPVRLGIGSPLGSGRQGVSWIHMEDLCKMIEFAFINERITGVYNAVSPEPVSNKQFMGMLAKTLRKPFIMPPVPSFLLQAFLGEKATIVLGGNYVSSKKIQNEGFVFTYEHLSDALKSIYET